jgi:hypothetical protein
VSFTADNLDTKIQVLRDFGLDNDQVRRVLQRFPQLLTVSAEQMAYKAMLMKTEYELSDEEMVKMLTLVPEFLALGVDSMRKKLAALEEIAGTGSAAQMWVSRPRILMYSSEELRKSFDFLTTEVGWSEDRIQTNIGMIMRNTDRFIRPRFEYLSQAQEFRTLDTVSWVMVSDAAFIEQHPDYAAFLQQAVRRNT